MYFASYDADGERNVGWVAETLPDTIEREFAGSHALLLVDCCFSGCLADIVKARAERVAYGCVLSSLASEVSTGNWTYTEAILAGFATALVGCRRRRLELPCANLRADRRQSRFRPTSN